MFGIGGSEVIVILIVALIFLGPDKLPHAAKQVSKGIRELKKGSRVLQDTIENDEKIGGALRDIKSALRGEDPPPPRPKRKKVKPKPALGEAVASTPPPGDAKTDEAKADAVEAKAEANDEPVALEAPTPTVKLPPLAGEPSPDVKTEEAGEELAALIRPAGGTVPKGSSEPN